MTAMNRIERRFASAYLAQENKKWTAECTRVPEAQWPTGGTVRPIEVWRSRYFLVQVFPAMNGGQRITVNRTGFIGNNATRWNDGITWDDLQRVKREIGRGNDWAVEIYPADEEIVNVANMRHLWLIDMPPFAWKKL